MDKKILEYKGITGSYEYNEKDKLFFGKILNTKDLIMYHGKDEEELIEAFKEAVEDYYYLNPEVKYV